MDVTQPSFAAAMVVKGLFLSLLVTLSLSALGDGPHLDWPLYALRRWLMGHWIHATCIDVVFKPANQLNGKVRSGTA